MAEHYTRSTLEVKAYCKKCSAFTMHDVQGGRKGACKPCMERLAKAPKQPPAAVQEGLF